MVNGLGPGPYPTYQAYPPTVLSVPPAAPPGAVFAPDRYQAASRMSPLSRRASGNSGLGALIERILDWLRSAFGASGTQAAALGDPNSNEAFVTDLYRRLLGREPDAHGMRTHLRHLRNGKSREHVYQNFLNSAEYQGRVASGRMAPAPAPRPVIPALPAPVAQPAMQPMPTPVPPVPAGPGAPLEGFDLNKLNNPNHRTPKYLFARVVQHVPLTSVRDHAGADALLRSIRPQLEAAGLRILDVKNDQIHVVTEIGAEWVDVIRGAGSGNPAWWWGSEGVPSHSGTPADGQQPPPVPQPAPQPAPPAAPAPANPAGPLTPEELAVAQAAGIAPDRANLEALYDEMQAEHAQNALGPGAQQPRYVSELQGVLKSWGYALDVNGQWDQATTEAVIKFRRDRNLPSAWRFADGSPGVHPFVDEAMKAAMRNKFAEDLGAGAGHWDELGIFRPSQPMADFVALTHSWVYDQPMRDGSGVPPGTNVVERAKQVKLATGRFVPYVRPNGEMMPIPRLR